LKRNLILAFVVIACLPLLSCGPFLAAGLRMLVTRGGAQQLASGAIRGGLGGEALAVTRAAQIGLGSVIVGDAALVRAATTGMRLQIGRNAAAIRGSASMQAGNVNVALAEGGTMQITRLMRVANRAGYTSNQYIAGRQVGYARFSADNIRVDFFVRQERGAEFSRMMYALRDPSGRSVSFFGVNHRYLGKVSYVPQNGTGFPSGEAATAALTLITVSDFTSTPLDQQCSTQLIIVRKTYFNQGITNESPNDFWDSMFEDCGDVETVSVQYQLFTLNKIRGLTSSEEKRHELIDFIQRFPNNREAVGLLRNINERLGYE
jgi:hypothetical protein